MVFSLRFTFDKAIDEILKLAKFGADTRLYIPYIQMYKLTNIDYKFKRTPSWPIILAYNNGVQTFSDS